MEEEHLHTRAAAPYRDPHGNGTAAEILAERTRRQLQGGGESSSAWRRRWAHRGRPGRFPPKPLPPLMLAVAVLAAGKGTRMKSDLPKVLQPLAGATLVERVLTSCEQLTPQRRLLIVGHQAERVERSLAHYPGAEFVLQQPQNGTGHAVQQLLEPLHGFEGELLVLNGDVPLLRPETLALLLERHRQSGAAVTLLTARLADPTGYGRVFADGEGRVSAIVEHRDCTPDQRTNNLTNAGIYCFDWPRLAAVLPTLTTDNDQGELYLTDTVALLGSATHLEVADSDEIHGINDRLQLAACEARLQQRLREHWMREGVTFTDPDSCTLSDGTRFGRDVIVDPQCHFRGTSLIGNRCRIGPGCLIENSEIADDVEVIHSVIRDSQVARGCAIGPFAQLRAQAVLGEDCRIGNFVEVKNSTLAAGVKANHLSYLGDADLGANVNIGAGTITANFDGVRKHRTVIGAGSKTGANSVLVAPITLGDGVTVGAGSTLTKNVPSGALALGRARQVVKEGWTQQG
jgi:bifunctional UDP-N-acetylglucosamine pyrophosphorylase/glucosamine-1-phosphate N-acetyltransferase